MTAGGIAAEPPVAAAPPPVGRAGAARPLPDGRDLPRTRAVHPRRVDGLPGRLHRRPQLLRPDRLSRHLGRHRQLQAALFTTPTLTTAIKNNAIWVAVVPGVRHRDRPDLRGADRARPLVGRVQDGRVPADGDLGVRDRRDVADHVPAGPERRGGQRARPGRGGRGQLAGRAAERTRRRRRRLDRLGVDRAASCRRRSSPAASRCSG